MSTARPEIEAPDRWFTADLHLGHANIIRFANRPYSSVEAMDQALIDGWNEVISDEDEVWCLGDIAMGQMDRTLPLISHLAGRKILVTGNHDRCWIGHTGRRAAARVPMWHERYLDAGFAEIHHGSVALDLAGRRVIANHFPYAHDSGFPDRYDEHRPDDDGHSWLLHGHVHGEWRASARMINVGVDVWDYRPVAQATLVRMIDGAEI